MAVFLGPTPGPISTPGAALQGRQGSVLHPQGLAQHLEPLKGARNSSGAPKLRGPKGGKLRTSMLICFVRDFSGEPSSGKMSAGKGSGVQRTHTKIILSLS